MAGVLVVGFKRSGVSAARILRKLGYTVYVYDKAGIDSLPEYVAADRSGYSLDRLFNGVDLVVLSPAVDPASELPCAARDRGLRVIGEIEAAYDAFRGEIAAVTGTNGKTTVTSLLEAVFKRGGVKAAAMGNIGKPFSDFIELDINTAILEVSSFQLETIDRFRPRAALFLNFAPDHLDRHKTMEGYFRAKLRIFENQRKGDYAIVNLDDPYLEKYFTDGDGASMLEQGPEYYFFSSAKKVKGAYVANGEIIFDDGTGCEKLICLVEEIKMKGRHNIENVLAAICAAKAFGVGHNAICSVIKEFEPPHARIEFVKKIGKTSFFNDSKGTNIHATVAAVRSMSGSTSLILGGSDKGEDFRDLYRVLEGKSVEVFVTGGNSDKILEAAAEFFDVRTTRCGTLTECVNQAYSAGRDNVLLSPASASFDRYKNYEERGEHFVALVKELEDKN